MSIFTLAMLFEAVLVTCAPFSFWGTYPEFAIADDFQLVARLDTKIA